MNIKKDDKNAIKNSTFERTKICNIDEKVDRILSENKKLFDRLNKKEFNLEKISLKYKKGNSIYFLRKRHKYDENTKSSDIFSNKSIPDVKKNNDKKLNETKIKKEEFIDNIDTNYLQKKRTRFDYEEEYNKKHPNLKTTDDLVKTKEFDKIVSQIEKEIDKIHLEIKNDVKKIVLKKLMENTEVDKSHEIGSIEKKSSEFDKKFPSFLKHETLEDEEKKEIDKVLPVTEDLSKSQKIEPKKLKPTKITDKKEKIIDKKDAGESKIKRLFFKTKKTSEVKPTSLKQKSSEIENIATKPIFHVEKIVLGDELEKEDLDLVNKKIIKSQGKEKKDEKPVIVNTEIKAKKLVEEHLRNKPTIISLNEESDKKSDTNLDLYISTNDKELGQEHIFFDEEDSTHFGWSPQIIEKEKNKGSVSSISQGEIGLNQLGKLAEIQLPKNFLSTTSVNLSELGFSENEWEELDFYALHEPFAYVEILRQRETLDKCYFLVEMALTEEEENLLSFIKDTLINLSIDAEEMEKKGEEEYLIEKLDQIIDEYNVGITDESKKKLYYFIGKSSHGLGKINPLMKDPNIEDISCDGSGVPVFLYHRKYGSLKSNIKFEDEDELSSFIFKLAQKCGKHISIAEPMLDATMPDGSRIQMTLSDEITAKGSTFTIRKFRADPFSPTDLIEFNTMSSEMIAYMWIAVENGINTLFAGGTASGKTTTLNAVMLFIPRESKIVSIEETREINLPHPNWIPGVSRSGFGEVVADKAVGEIDTYDLMKAALRQRPEYIIVGEIRGKEAYVLFQAMATGHATYSTAHADSAQSLIHRLEGKPINIPRIMLQSLDLVCIHIITRVKNMRARRCKQIIEIIDIDPTTKEILTNEVFRWDPVEDKFIYSGKSYILERIRTEKDLTREEMSQEINNRKTIIEWMNTNNIRGFKDVANIVSKYAETPGELLKKLGKDNN